MSLKEIINEDLKAAMKSGDKLKLETIRSIRALIIEFEKSGAAKELKPDDEIKMLTTAAKKRKDSIEQFRNAGREELAQKEERELEILSAYLPKQLDEAEINAEVSRIAQELGASSKADFPKLMPEVMKQLKGKADGKLVRTLVESFLSGN
ncbi:MAG: glutamyl-tRNA amidotransferase [Ignavibacteria bacterium CG2_30_36_16]|nr:GatB/YqeY domain-containing protein [Ignavibacteria bacterium]OIP56140.1 MAG: glutamyl-tRNA amidotransferase [Ignavibacteria bacterium CG2_30_36_16]PJB00661.1 MAG: glutamyl-tRNA amidotransferase [Ignavibacteria bacterium CG_4_9_14_3_um_filter_36_18]